MAVDDEAHQEKEKQTNWGLAAGLLILYLHTYPSDTNNTTKYYYPDNNQQQPQAALAREPKQACALVTSWPKLGLDRRAGPTSSTAMIARV